MLGAAGNTDRFDWMVAGQGLSTAGQDIVPRRMATHTGDADGLRARAATARLGVRLDAATRVEALFRWRQNHLQLDDAPFQRLDDPDYWGRDRNWLGSVRAETTLAGVWTTGLRVSVTQDRRRYVNQPDPINFSDSDDSYRSERRTVDWGNQLRLGDVGAFRDVGLAFGITHQRESSDSRSISFGTVTSTDARADSMAYHAGLQGRLLERLDLTFGLRHDEADGYDGFTSWRAGGVLAVPEIASRLRASAGTGFKAPSLFQRFGVIGTFFRGNPNLRPERSFSWEAGIETDVALAGRPDFATFGATYFDQRFRQLINFNPAFDSLENIDRAKARGVELSATIRPADWLETTLAWTITETLDEATGRPLPRRPRNVLALSARVEPVAGFVLVPELLFTGPSLEGAFAAYDTQGNAITVPSYNTSGTVVNLAASYRVTPQVTAFAEGRNLGGSRYEPANGFVTPGRSLLVGTRFVF
jgi:vitamin B12 transporter